MFDLDLTATSRQDTPVTAPFKVDPFKGSNSGAVSRQWVARPSDERYLDLNSMAAHFEARDLITETEVIRSKKLEIIVNEDPQTEADTHDLQIGTPSGEILDPSHYAFGQLCGLVKAPASYLRTLPAQNVQNDLGYGLIKRGVDDVKLIKVGKELPGIVGPQYGRIRNSEVIRAVQQIAGNGTGDERWKAPGVIDWSTHYYDPFAPITLDSTTFYASDRDMFVFLVDDTHPIEIGKLADGSPDYVFRGFYTTNSEVGAGALKIAAFYLRGVCMNRNLWGIEGFQEINIRHTSGAPSRFVEEARPALLSFSNGSEKALIEGVQKAKAAKVADDEAEALAFLRKKGFSAKRAKEIAQLDAEAGAQREEGDFPRTAWDMAQGITAYARTLPNNNDRVEIEAVAGKILDKVAA